MANNIALDNADLLVTDSGDNIILSVSDRHEDIIEFRLSMQVINAFNSSINMIKSFNSNIIQVKDFTKSL